MQVMHESEIHVSVTQHATGVRVDVIWPGGAGLDKWRTGFNEGPLGEEWSPKIL
jgi:hypothetical protein